MESVVSKKQDPSSETEEKGSAKQEIAAPAPAEFVEKDDAILKSMDVAAISKKAEPAKEKAIQSYQDEVWLSTWKRRSAGLWAGTLCGAGFGAAIGLISCLVAAAVTGAALVPMLAAVVPIVTTLGITSGIAAFTLVGASSGAIAHGLKEQDKRLQAAGLQVNAAESEKTKGKNSRRYKFFNWKVGLAGFFIAAPLGALFAVAGGGALITVASLGGLKLGADTLMCLSVMICGLNGAIFGFDGPKIALNATNMFGKFLSGKVFEKEKGNTPALALEPSAPVVTGVKAKEQKVTEVAFKGDTVKTVVTPIGSYAGKEAGFHTRRLAEQQFHALDPRSSIPH